MFKLNIVCLGLSSRVRTKRTKSKHNRRDATGNDVGRMAGRSLTLFVFLYVSLQSQQKRARCGWLVVLDGEAQFSQFNTFVSCGAVARERAVAVAHSALAWRWLRVHYARNFDKFGNAFPRLETCIGIEDETSNIENNWCGKILVICTHRGFFGAPV